jgi:hypothetical protein
MAEARYDAVADFYTRAFDVLDDPATTELLDLLGPPAGLQVLDIACGRPQGSYARLGRPRARLGRPRPA